MVSRSWTGVLAGTASALIGGGWQVVTRHSTTAAEVAPGELAALRYLLPAIVLAPLLRGLLRPGRPWAAMALMAAGGGLPFGLLAISGTAFAPAAHMGVLVAGASPLLAAALAALLWGERVGGIRLAGLGLMACGVASLSVALPGATGLAWLGDLLFLLAALAWAVFTLAYRRSGLGPWQAAAVVNCASAAMILPWVLLHGLPTLQALPWPALALQALWQGVLAGLLAFALFAFAIDRLGASAASFGALVPVAATVGGWVWLGDPLGRAEAFAVAATSCGVLLASGFFSRR